MADIRVMSLTGVTVRTRALSDVKELLTRDQT
jgi:hypothetical protein